MEKEMLTEINISFLLKKKLNKCLISLNVCLILYP